ncbi:MAG: hypothetical protein WCF81_16915 [Roseiarcus sp.]
MNFNELRGFPSNSGGSARHGTQHEAARQRGKARTFDPSEFLPFSPNQFEPYRTRTRLFRTMNDVLLAISGRSNIFTKAHSASLTSPGGATGGAFHPTAEGHAAIANDAAVELCQRVGCGP